MTIHKRTRLTPLDRQEIWRLYGAAVVGCGASVAIPRLPVYHSQGDRLGAKARVRV